MSRGSAGGEEGRRGGGSHGRRPRARDFVPGLVSSGRKGPEETPQAPASGRRGKHIHPSGERRPLRSRSDGARATGRLTLRGSRAVVGEDGEGRARLRAGEGPLLSLSAAQATDADPLLEPGRTCRGRTAAGPDEPRLGSGHGHAPGRQAPRQLGRGPRQSLSSDSKLSQSRWCPWRPRPRRPPRGGQGRAGGGRVPSGALAPWPVGTDTGSVKTRWAGGTPRP